MSSYPPPRNILPIFNEEELQFGDSGLTLSEADLRYLRLTGGSLSGNLTATSLTSSGNIFVNDGTVLLPSLTFTDDSDSGLYRIAADNIGLSIGGSKILDIAATGMDITGLVNGRNISTDGTTLDTLDTNLGSITAGEASQIENINSVTISNTQWGYIGDLDQALTTTDDLTFNRVLCGDGTNLAPSFSFTSQSNAGIRFNSPYVSFVLGGNDRFEVGSTDILVNEPMLFELGNATNPSISFQGDTNTGIFSEGANAVNISCDGVTRFKLDNTELELTEPIRGTAGSSNFPSYSFSADIDTGMYQTSPGLLEFSIAGTRKMFLNSVGLILGDSVFAIDGTASEPAYSFSDDGNTGIYSSAGDTLDFSTNGTKRLTIDSVGDVTIDAGKLIANSTSSSNMFHELYRPNSSSTLEILRLYSDNGSTRNLVWSVEGDGSTTSNTGVYTTLSDERLKKDISDKDTKSCLDNVLKLKVKNYTRKDSNRRMIGLLAQDVETVFPHLVADSNDNEKIKFKDDDGKDYSPKKIIQSHLIYEVIAAIQELHKIVLKNNK